MKKTNQGRNGLLIALLVTSGFILSSCMHLGMLGHGEEHEQTTEPTLVKEVVSGEVKAAATFPALKIGKETQFSLRLSHSGTLRPLSGAQVFGHFDFIHRPDSQETEHMGMVHGHVGSSQTRRREGEHDISFHLELKESKEPGVYVFSQTPSQIGEHNVGFHITSIGDRKLAPDILIEVKRNATGQAHGHGGGMMGMGETGTYLVIGAAVMSAMWIAMVLARGGMF